MQFDFPGQLAIGDGRYLSRDTTEGGGERVLVVETLAAPAPPRRRRRKPKPAEGDGSEASVPLARVTVVRAAEPFGSAEEAKRWLQEAVKDDAADALADEAVALLGRTLHIEAVASADPHVWEPSARQAVAVRLGYGSGEEVAAGRFSEAYDVDVGTREGSQRQQRATELRTQARLAAVLGGRERLDACETLLLRARADLDAGRMREAALQLRGALESLLVELDESLADPAHEQDMGELGGRRGEAAAAAEAALRGRLGSEHERSVRELTEICERVLRRRRVLGA